MKKFLLITCGVFLCFASSCSSDDGSENEPLKSDEVKVYLTYTFDTSSGGNMARFSSTNEEVFNEFYEEIKTGELLAPSYNITFTNVDSGVTYNFKGNWADNEFVTLRTGAYNVTGYSTATGDNVQDKCSIVFDEQINISITSKVVTLNAEYDCSLLIFNDEAIQSLHNYNGEDTTSFYSFKTYKYAFVNDCVYKASSKNEAYIIGKYTNDAEFLIYTGNLNFEKGKYYVYNSVSNSLSFPPMTEGDEETNREIEGFGKVADAVDLGLSVKWASWNVGASQIADYEGLYGAGDPTGLLTSTSYSDYYFQNNSSICGTEYDIASVKWGYPWRMPTWSELNELMTDCTWEIGEVDDIKGCIITGPNGHSIFLPFSGHRTGSNISSIGSKGYYYSSDMQNNSNFSYCYRDLDINISEIIDNSYGANGSPNYFGQSIRPVCE